VPICFALSGTTLYSVVDRKPKRAAPERLRRLRNIRENPHVAVVVDAYRENWSRLGFVLLEGTARVVESGAEHARALRLLRRKYRQYRSMNLDGRPIIAVGTEWVVAWGRITPS
jgi:PPOX class probable F420-dependent enzyme